MKKRFLIASMLFAGVLGLASCGGNEDTTESSTENNTSIPSLEESIPSIEVPSEDNPSEDVPSIPVQESNETEDNYAGFSATVVYPDGSPVVGVDVQWCVGEACYTAIKTDANGVAKNPSLNKGSEYIVHILELSIPFGYTYNPNLYTVNDDNLQVTIQLEVLNELTGEGSKEAAYVLNEGYSKIYFETVGNGGIQYFSFTANDAATYEIESIYDVNAAFIAKPVLHEYEEGYNNRIAQRATPGTGLEDNFKYSFEATANTTYYFGIGLLDGSPEMIDLPIVITKK